MKDTAPYVGVSSGGRGARARIVATATKLFYEQGISTTGLKQLTDEAHVSTRSFYLHFASKDDLVVEYLTRFETAHLIVNEASLDDLDRAPAERLLGLFGATAQDSNSNFLRRGCPFHNAAVEAPTLDDRARAVVLAHKEQFLAKIVATARDAGLRAPRQIGYQLAILYEGAAAWTTSTGDPATATHARRAATQLISLAAS